MRVITGRRLQAHWEQRGRADSEGPLRAWYAEAKKAGWRTSADIKAKFASASFIADNRVVFNIGGNKYRLVVHVNYEIGVVLVKFVGTHAEYDAIDPVTIGGGGAPR
ncbi:MAG: type II toxin-antitoxin system HigB family toxin [Rhodospirillales bacterium]|nr:type II toxin-antitoxin system HigB family toxin [Rhodospirillales bacterium]